MPAAWIVNPSRRRSGKKHRSAAQRAATARMLAANRSGGGRRSRRARRNPSSALSMHRTRRSFNSMAPGALSMLKAAGVAGGGAVLVDVAMGYLGRVLPSAASPINADGTTNWLYFAAKAGLAVGLGTGGRRILPPQIAARMGEGALTVLAYQIMRGLVPAGVALGNIQAYFNPAPTVRPTALAGSGKGGQSLAGSGGGGSSLAAYADAGEASAARAANIVRMVNSRRS